LCLRAEGGEEKYGGILRIQVLDADGVAGHLESPMSPEQEWEMKVVESSAAAAAAAAGAA